MDGVLPAAKLVFEKKDGKVPMTPGLKETPKGTHHLHFLLSAALTNFAESTIPPLLDNCLPLGRAHPFRAELPHCPLPFVTQSPLSSPQTRLRSSWSRYQARPMKTRLQRTIHSTPTLKQQDQSRTFSQLPGYSISPVWGDMRALWGNTAASPLAGHFFQALSSLW